VVVTGGSQGIGLELTKRFHSAGAKVTIMARNTSKLEQAKEEIGDGIQVVSVDVSDYDEVREAMEEAVKKQEGLPIFVLVHCAGQATPGYFLNQDMKVFENTMRLNYLGTVFCARVVVEMMLKAKTKGQIVFLSSAAASASFLGYSSYAPTKAAIRSFSDALRNELCGTGISIHIAYPPDTETPGFAKENETKPKETLKISPPEVYSAKAVANEIMSGLLRREYHLPSPDFIQNLLLSTGTNITPRGKWAIVEIALAPIIFLVMWGFKIHADRVSRKYGESIIEVK